MIELKKITRIYETDEIETVALSEINLTVNKGEFVSIMGPSGCGKSTLLNLIGMIDSPSSGEYFFKDEEIATYSERKRSQLRKHNVGFIFQSFNLIDELTVFKNVELPMVYTKVPPSERKKRVETELEKLNMMHRRNHYPQQLSGGQQQRVAVARALVNRPSLILADEPTGNLDTQNGDEVLQLISKLHKEGTTIVMVTHSNHDASFGDRIIHMLDGKILAENAPQHPSAIS